MNPKAFIIGLLVLSPVCDLTLTMLDIRWIFNLPNSPFIECFDIIYVEWNKAVQPERIILT